MILHLQPLSGPKLFWKKILYPNCTEITEAIFFFFLLQVSLTCCWASPNTSKVFPLAREVCLFSKWSLRSIFPWLSFQNHFLPPFVGASRIFLKFNPKAAANPGTIVAAYGKICILCWICFQFNFSFPLKENKSKTCSLDFLKLAGRPEEGKKKSSTEVNSSSSNFYNFISSQEIKAFLPWSWTIPISFNPPIGQFWHSLSFVSKPQ